MQLPLHNRNQRWFKVLGFQLFHSSHDTQTLYAYILDFLEIAPQIFPTVHFDFSEHLVVLYKGFNRETLPEGVSLPSRAADETPTSDIDDIDVLNDPCCDWIGEGGSGHFIKMVHKGIESGDMQVLAEAYALFKDILKLPHDEMGQIFEEWNNDVLDSFLIEISGDILKFKDTDGDVLVPKIHNAARQKSTQFALELGIPATLIGEAVFARCLSALKDERVAASKILKGPEGVTFSGDRKTFIDNIKQAVYASKIISYAQGFIKCCVIGSAFLGDITNAFCKNKDLQNLLLGEFFTKAIHKAMSSYRRVVSQASLLGVP
ncbi:hypothetical protein HK097_003104, partial [Rhizophlyctis rosea]